FLLQNFQWLLARVGVIYQPPHLDILLPVGISFYTFHALSYTLVIYRGVLKPTRSLRDFVLAVSFFPQLVAGPIVRAGDFLPQLVEPPRLKTNQFLWGLALMTLGLFEKIVLADTLLSGTADRIFGYAGPLVALDSWAGVLAFAGQIFCDFAGYSLTAIGAALTLGFHFKDNFRFPYAAFGFSDFWGRRNIADPVARGFCDLRRRLHRLGFLSRARFHRRQPNVGRNVWAAHSRRHDSFHARAVANHNRHGRPDLDALGHARGSVRNHCNE